MISDYFREIEALINSLPIILSSNFQFEVVDMDRGFLKISLVLLDSSQISIFEYVEIKNKPVVEKYRYHWQNKNSQLIKRWDNAPHHQDIETFPHHLHDSGGVKPHAQPTIKQVIDVISKEMGWH